MYDTITTSSYYTCVRCSSDGGGEWGNGVLEFEELFDQYNILSIILHSVRVYRVPTLYRTVSNTNAATGVPGGQLTSLGF